MSFKVQLGRKIPKKLKLNGTQYQMLDPTEFLLDLFTFRPKNRSYFPTDHWELVIINLIGGMGAGKSESIKNIALILQSIYRSEFHCFQTNDLIYSLNYLNHDIYARKKVELIVFDDALDEGMDSRRSMSNENVAMSQNLSIVRHLLANEDENKQPDPRVKNGFCVIIYAIQSPTRLDKFIRENAHLTIYKSYYENLEREKEVSDDAIRFIKDVTEDSMYKHTYAARGAGLGITKTKKCMQMYFPKVQFPIPVLVPPPERYAELMNEILKFDLCEVKENVLKGFIQLWCEKNSISLAATDIVNLLNKAKYYQWRGVSELKSTEKTQSAKDIERQQTIETILKLRDEKVSWRKIGHILGVNHTTAYNLYQEYIYKLQKNSAQAS